MKKSIVTMLAVLSVLMLILAGCGPGSTGAVPRAPPLPSGGGCGIGAPADVQSDLATVAEDSDKHSAL